jgi:hypothetical protein
VPTPVQVTRADVREGRIVRLGGMFNGKPWSMSVVNIISEIDKPDGRRQWDFEASAHDITAPVVLEVRGWQASLKAEGVDLFSLPECPPEWLEHRQ